MIPAMQSLSISTHILPEYCFQHTTFTKPISNADSSQFSGTKSETLMVVHDLRMWSRGIVLGTTSFMTLARIRGRLWGLRWSSTLVSSPWKATSNRAFLTSSARPVQDCRQWCFYQRPFDSIRLLPSVSIFLVFLPSS